MALIVETSSCPAEKKMENNIEMELVTVCSYILTIANEFDSIKATVIFLVAFLKTHESKYCSFFSFFCFSFSHGDHKCWNRRHFPYYAWSRANIPIQADLANIWQALLKKYNVSTENNAEDYQNIIAVVLCHFYTMN